MYELVVASGIVAWLSIRGPLSVWSIGVCLRPVVVAVMIMIG